MTGVSAETAVATALDDDQERRPTVLLSTKQQRERLSPALALDDRGDRPTRERELPQPLT
jgi:hypothetical protein